jgi:hypothetical protein
LVNKLVYFRIDKERLSRVIPFWRVADAEQSFAVHPPKRGEVIVFHFPATPAGTSSKESLACPETGWKFVMAGSMLMDDH